MPNAPILLTPSPAAHKLEAIRQPFPQAMEVDADGRIRIDAAQLQRALDPANPAGKGYDSWGEISDKEKWKIQSARHFFKALDDLGVPVQYKTKANGDQLAQLIQQIDPSISKHLT